MVLGYKTFWFLFLLIEVMVPDGIVICMPKGQIWYDFNILQSRHFTIKIFAFYVKEAAWGLFCFSHMSDFFFFLNAAFQMKTFTFFHLGVEPLS